MSDETHLVWDLGGPWRLASPALPVDQDALLVVLHCGKCNGALKRITENTVRDLSDERWAIAVVLVPVCRYCTQRSQSKPDDGAPDALLPRHKVEWPAAELRAWVDRARGTRKTQHLVLRMPTVRYDGLTTIDQPVRLEW